MLCLHPELKLETVKRVIPQVKITIEDLASDSSKDDLTKMYALVSKYEGHFNYL